MDYTPLRVHSMHPGISFHQPRPADAKRVRAEDAAIKVMTDFVSVRALTVTAGASADYALQRMKTNRVRLLLVVDPENAVLGLITATDLQGEKPVQLVTERGIRRDELLVADVMTPAERLEVLDLVEIGNARVGHVHATLKAIGRQHALVVDRDAKGRQCLRGLFSASQLCRQLGIDFQPDAVAHSFAEIERALLH